MRQILTYPFDSNTTPWETIMGFQTKEDLLADVTKDIEEIELAEPRGKHPADLSSIESTAPSKTAWLIAIVVSIGGLLFGWSLQRPYLRHLSEDNRA